MKLSRLLTYAAAGVITGLLIENRALLTREQIKEQGRKLKDKISDKLKKAEAAIPSAT